jgi:acyl-CoA hydrolase
MTSAEEAVQCIEPGHRVFLHGACAVPQRLLAALGARIPELHDVEIVHLHAEGEAPHLAPEAAGHVRHRALFIGSNARQAIWEGRADYVPVFLSDIPALFRSRRLAVDVALLNLSTPDQHGFCSLGTSVDCAKAAAEEARIVIAQINPSVPRTLGDSFVHVDQLTWAVEVDEPPYCVEPEPVDDVARRIGEHVAELVADGSTLQLGIGAIPNAVLACLRDRRELGVHTEMFSDGVVDLVEAGVITGSRKEVHRGKLVSSFLMGTQRLYDFVHDNPMVELHPIDYTNDTALIRRHRRMVAINSAIEVDLTGQVCADSIGHRLYSGVGGQMDFMRGAALAEEGKPIIALPSTAKKGTVSRIVSRLKDGAGVVTTRAHVHYVVTEYGVAYLHGKSLRERARALVAIAHPDFREDLRREAEAWHRW